MPDLGRLLSPTSIAVFGGGWAVKVIEECQRFGFEGAIWPVHPTKSEIAGVRAYPSVSDLPAAPDAAFVGVNRHATLEVVRALSEVGAGGAVLFASGFAETGNGDLQTALLDAAGDMAILGPNCYGIVNALDGAVIWPDQQGAARVDRGVAILSQSSNIAITLTMQRRGLPVAYVACVGNAAQTSGSDLARAMLADERVTALGLYVEGFGDVAAFAAVADEARALGKGIVVLKAGRSERGRSAAVSHTAALAGEGDVSSAFLSQCGVGEVTSLSEMIEALKILHAFGPLPQMRYVSVSCSGGEAGLMADRIQETKLEFPSVPGEQAEKLGDLLGPLVTISNPLDYHTFIWGETERMTAVFTTTLDGFDAGLFVLDPPRADRCSTASYDCAFAAMGAARAVTGKPVFTVSTLPDSIDEESAARLEALGVVPLLDPDTALKALDVATLPKVAAGWRPLPVVPIGAAEVMDEASAKCLLQDNGVDVPRSVSAEAIDGLDAGGMKPPFALKGLGFAHKTEAGAVRLDVTDPLVEPPMHGARGYLLEEMIPGGVAEVLVGVRRDPVYGTALTLGAGGRLAELLDDTVTRVLPITPDETRDALAATRIGRVLEGFRGGACADLGPLLRTVQALQDMMRSDPSLVEIEINPLIVTETRAVAADALIRRLT